MCGKWGALLAMLAMTGVVDAAPPSAPGADLTPVAYGELHGWHDDDHSAAFATFRVSCNALLADAPALRPARTATPALVAICQQATDAGTLDSVAAKRFFETHFTAYRVTPTTGGGFLTGYFEPEITGSLTRSDAFPAPVYGRPADLVTLAPGDARGDLDPVLAAARRTAAGTLEPYPVRSEIYAGGLTGRSDVQLYLRDEAEVFIVQVQGSARVRLTDGRRVRLGYAGRNGHPYTSIGRLLIEEGRIAAHAMSLEHLMGWLRANPADAMRVMSANRSYVFFTRQDDTDPTLGPTGGAGVPLTPGRSLAVDRAIWPYGLPVWCQSSIATLDPALGQIRRLMIAQDTGSAIVGPARADYFWGSGDEAGRRAGLTRHTLGFTILWPNAP